MLEKKIEENTVDVAPLQSETRRRFTKGGIAVLVLGVFVFTSVTYIARTQFGGDNSIQETEQEKKDPEVALVDLELLDDDEFGELPLSLVQSHSVRSGISIGYVKRSINTSELIIRGQRLLEEESQNQEQRIIVDEDSDVKPIIVNKYDATLFFRKNDDGDAQIYAYNVAESELKQLTDDESRTAQSTPLFSTSEQTLAYSLTNRESNSFGVTCDTLLHDFDSNEVATVDLGLPNKTCVEPVAWSPSSKRLMLVSREIDASEQNSGQYIPYFYDLDNREAIKMNPPGSFDSLRSLDDFRWISDDRAIMTFADYDEFGDFVDRKVFFYDFVDNRIERIDVAAIYADSYFESGGQALARLRDTSENRPQEGQIVRYSAGVDESSIQPIDDTIGAVDIFARRDSDDSAQDFVFLQRTQVDEESPVVTTLRTLRLQKDSTPIEPVLGAYFDFRGDDPALLGWSESYDEMLYSTTTSSGNEIRLYNQADKTDLLVARNLNVLR